MHFCGEGESPAARCAGGLGRALSRELGEDDRGAAASSSERITTVQR